MVLRKCPRCELNYILDGGDLCSVCCEEVHGHRGPAAAPALCAICGEAPPMQGDDLCGACLAEMRAIERAATEADHGSGDGDDAGVATGHLEDMQAAEDLQDDDDGADSEAEAAARAEDENPDGEAGEDDGAPYARAL